VAPITVQAAAKPKVIEKQTHDFVGAFAQSASPELDQIGRWREPVCVKVLGLTEDQNALVKTRIEDVAKAVNQHVGRSGCSANIEIVFTDQPQAMMDAVSKRAENLLGYYHRHDHDKLKKVSRPVQAWYVTATLGGGGDIAGAMFNQGTGTIPVQQHREVIDDPENPAPVSCGINPHFTGCLQSEFKNVFVVADTKALAGKDAGLLSDYLVMLTLAQPSSLDGCNILPSVLDALSKAGCPGRDVPDGLTSADASYLTSLYEADLEDKKMSEVGDIAGRMAKILNTAAAQKR
jgi:hypothetical protein